MTPPDGRTGPIWLQMRRQDRIIAGLEADLSALHDSIKSCIWVTPQRMSGSPCVGGTRIPTSLIAGIENDEDVLDWYEGLTEDQVKLARWFHERFLDRYPSP